MYKYTGLIKCAECNHSFKGRNERGIIKYRCNYRLKFGKNKCSNDEAVEETFITNMISQQLDVINMNIENVNISSIVKEISVSNDRIEIFFQNLPINSCYIDSKAGKLHYDALTD